MNFIRNLFSRQLDSGPKIKFGFRGEGIEYKLDDKEICINSTWIDEERIYTDSIIKWDNGDALTRDEKSKIFADVIAFVRREARKKPIVVINRNTDAEFWESMANANISEISKVEFTSNKDQDQLLYDMFLSDLKTGLAIDGVVIRNKEELDMYWSKRTVGSGAINSN